MKHLRYVTALLAAAFTVVAASAQDARLDRGARMAGRGIGVDKAVVTRHGGYVGLDMVLNLDSLELPANTRLVYRPGRRSPCPVLLLTAAASRLCTSVAIRPA